MHTDGHDMGKDTVGQNSPGTPHDASGPGYETTDVNVNGVVVFLGGLAGFLVVFFFVCYGFGILINNLFEKQDGPANKWKVAAGVLPTAKGNNLASNPEMQQKVLQNMTSNFPQPRLDVDDGNQATADLHAREDLLLDHYSSTADQPGVIRIPIDRAMELIAQRGLPVSAAATPSASVAESAAPQIAAPLTSGFARTGYELTVIEAREQKMNFGKAESSAHAQLTPVK